MIFNVISIFPGMFDSITKFGVTSRAFENNICYLNFNNPRDFTNDPYKRVDDKPFGGGPGMVMNVEPLELAFKQAVLEQRDFGVVKPLCIYMSPQGKSATQNLVNDLALKDGIIFVCGRYEGVDERFIESNVDLEISIGDFVVSGGELPAMMLIDSIMRQIPGVLNDKESARNDSFMNELLDYPHYTLPRSYCGVDVPDVLLSGNHKQIELWRLQMSLWRTYVRRPDLLQSRKLTEIESGLLEEMIKNQSK
ncbi:MAG: tRNA (guanosine(37)-N1)-methyltransferase TrmD [Neisseriaceae bacterium]